MGVSAQVQISAPQDKRHGLVPTLVVAALLFSLYFGSQALNAVIRGPANEVGQSTDGAISLGPIQLLLQPGWQIGALPSGAPAISKGSVSIIVATYGVSGDARALYTAYVDDELANTATGFAATTADDVLIGGLPAARGAYNGVLGSGVGQVDGEVTTVVAGDQGYVFDARGPMGTLHPLRREINEMLATLVVQQ